MNPPTMKIRVILDQGSRLFVLHVPLSTSNRNEQVPPFMLTYYI